MDDPSAEIRLYAAQCIGELKLNAKTTTDIDLWRVVAKHLFESLILHLEGPEINFRKALLGMRIELMWCIIINFVKSIIDSMSKLTENKTNAEVFQNVVVKLPVSYPYLKELEKVTEHKDIS